MTEQEAFNKVWNHFLVNNGLPSVAKAAWCLYRNDMNADCPTRCAIGVLIPDEEYSKDFEAGVGLKLVADKVNALRGLNHQFLSSLQSAHDHWAGEPIDEFRLNFRIEMGEIAKKFNLKIPNDCTS